MAKARIDLEQIKEDWLVGNSVVTFAVALLTAQALKPSDVDYVLPVIDVSVPAIPEAVVLGFVALLAASSLALALTSTIPPLRSWAIERVSHYSVALEYMMSVAFLLSLVAALVEIPSEQGWARALWWGGVALVFFLWARLLFRPWALPGKWMRRTFAKLMMKARNRFAGLSRGPNDADTSGGE